MERKNILIVEDEMITALDIQIRLQANGYRHVDYVETGEEAIKIIEKGNVDLVLMDVKLKGPLDGVGTTKEIVSQYKVPIIFITGNTDRHMVSRLKATKPAGIISKPINDKELFESVDTALQHSG